jgi:TPR repeat protein
VAVETTAFTLTARGKGGVVTQQTTVNVEKETVTETAKPEPPPKTVDPKELFESAEALRHSGQPAQAIPLFRQAASLGNADAMVQLAQMLRSGEGISENSAEAFTWFQKAADKGNVSAMVFLAALYAQGRGVSRDDAKAAEWFQKAAGAGDGAAMDALGRLYTIGRGVSTKDPVEAARWYRKAAKSGNPDGMEHLAGAYESGAGVARDIDEAIRWHSRAASAGNGAARSRLEELRRTQAPHTPAPSPVTVAVAIPVQPTPRQRPPAQAIGTAVSVPSNQNWTDTGITLHPGDGVSLDATGSVNVNVNRIVRKMSPAGLASADCNTVPRIYGRIDNFLAPQFPCWAMLGRVGSSGTIFLAGAKSWTESPSGGRLYLGINDGNPAGNSGAWSVTLAIKANAVPAAKSSAPSLTLTGIQPGTIRESKVQKYKLTGSGLTADTRITLNVRALIGSKPRAEDFRAAKTAEDGTWIEIYIGIGALPNIKSVRITASKAGSAAGSLDVPAKK